MKKFIKSELSSLANTISKSFQQDELAYLVLQQKIERPIRDKIAWELQKALDQKYGQGELMVRCEWPSWYDEQNLDYSNSQISARSAVDIAILKMNQSRDDYEEILALIEFKHHAFLNTETWPYESFIDDVSKMYKMTQISRKGNVSDKRINNADMYFVMLITSHNQQNCNAFGSAVVYWNLLHACQKRGKNKAILYNDPSYVHNLREFWKGFFNLNFQCKYTSGQTIAAKSTTSIAYNNTAAPSVQQPEIQHLGSSFNYDMYLSCMIWGPYDYNKLNVVP